ncbi:tRNA (adenosine(37)-N6)-dimethylallyltransferase MiaA [Candidatus Peregrinibacteria bacterium]|nr:tRNA (adenosine(37)-N6)-dimethylallyltransferase MiaA [Candidatus Peregrinibacteria bacterium]
MQTSHLQERLRNFIRTARHPLIVILGPTASGKTAFSIDLAISAGDAEIINADSRQLYKYMNIGTAKITAEETRGVQHHMLDVLDPKEETTAAWYKKEAVKMIEDIHRRRRVPILVGGSMLYLSAIVDGLEFPAASDPALREKLEKEYEVDEGKSLHEKLMKLDPETASAFSANNKPYVIRAMEIHENTGMKPSVARRRSAPPYDLFMVGMARPRGELHRRIGERTAELFNKGWIGEVRGLLEKGYSSGDPGMKSHGYREIIDKWRLTEDGRRMLADRISAKARQYAKKQMTWWRGDSRIQWVSPGPIHISEPAKNAVDSASLK